ncbi:MAG TPA: hypothetical protein VFQ43_16015 [Nitrososphaera sp.]|nr:hypothetical protein [Nitrososphaera sp.]
MIELKSVFQYLASGSQLRYKWVWILIALGGRIVREGKQFESFAGTLTSVAISVGWRSFAQKFIEQFHITQPMPPAL